MIDDEDRARRMAVVRRIAIGMAEQNGDPILARTNILIASSYPGKPTSEEALDARHPVAMQSDGGRYFPYVRTDGRGQINIIWPDGTDKTIKFRIPEEYLTGEMEDFAGDSLSLDRGMAAQHSKASQSELQEVIGRIKNADSLFPTSISQIPTFPFSNFSEMQKAIEDGTFTLAKFSFNQDLGILRLVSPSSRPLYIVSMIATYIVPAACVVLAIILSYWFFLGIFYFFVGARMTIAIWKRSILRAAYCSEAAFCLLFYTSKISAYDNTIGVEYEWQKIKKEG